MPSAKTKPTKVHQIVVMNGPNLKHLGKREPQIYGNTTWAEIEVQLHKVAKVLGVKVSVVHASSEGELIDALHAADHNASAVLLNPGGLGHSSVALRDAVATLKVPVIEVHVSNLARRESFRSHSYISAVASGSIMGFGVLGYEMGLWAAHRVVIKDASW